MPFALDDNSKWRTGLGWFVGSWVRVFVGSWVALGFVWVSFPRATSVGFSLCGLTARAAMSVPPVRHPYLPKGARIFTRLFLLARITQKQHALGPSGPIGFQSSNSILVYLGLHMQRT